MLIGIDASRAFISQRTGTENYSYCLIKAFTRIDKKNSYRLYTHGVTEEKIDVDLPPNFSVENISWGRFWTQGGLALATIKNPPDILFIPAHTLPLLRELSRNKTRTVVTIHDLGYEYLPNYYHIPNFLYLNKSTEWAVKWANALIAVSEATRIDLINKMHCDSKKIFVVHEGVDITKFKNQNSKIKKDFIFRKYGIGEKYILFVGTIQPRKNLERLIEAFSLVRKSFGNLDLELIIIGKPGWMYEPILVAPKKYGVEEYVRFLNFVPEEDLVLLYRYAQVFCLPSLFEGFGLPVLEAMASGCPVVVSDSSSLPEIVGDAGIHVDTLSYISIASGIKRILGNDTLRNSLIAKGRQRAREFTWEKTAKRTLAVFEKTRYRGNKETAG
jgi:glycosyltransferase involved in cell wall biosynthesis